MCTLSQCAFDTRLSFKAVSKIFKQIRDAVATEHGNARRREASVPTTKLLDWSRKHLPHYFKSKPSRMHTWLATKLEGLSRSRLPSGISDSSRSCLPDRTSDSLHAGDGSQIPPGRRDLLGPQIPPGRRDLLIAPSQSPNLQLNKSPNKKLNILAPRGAAKSTLGTLAFVLKAALEKVEPYIWIVSDTKHQACAHLENIKTELTENKSLAADYPAAAVGPKWRANRITLKNGVTIEAYGTGQRIRGQRHRENRPTLIVCDDLQNDSHILSPTQRERSRSWFHGTLAKAGTPNTSIVNLATALHRDALAMELHHNPGWTSGLFKSIVRWPDNMSLWHEWEAIYTSRSRLPSGTSETPQLVGGSEIPPASRSRLPSGILESPQLVGCSEIPPGRRDLLEAQVPSGRRDLLSVASSQSPNLQTNKSPNCPTIHPSSFITHHSASGPSAARQFYEDHRAEMDAGAILLWPEVEDLYTLMCMRVEGGQGVFEREKQNSPTNPDLCEWPESYFDESIWFETWPKNLIVKTMALDPSKGTKTRRGDFSAFVSLGVDRQGIIHIEADMARRPAPQIVADGVERYRLFQPHIFGIEANQFQDLFAGQFESEFQKQGMLAARPYPIDNTVPKLVRIRRLGPYLSTHRLRFKSNSPSTSLLVEQLKQFPIADHDDGPDALEMALRLADEFLAVQRFNDGLGHRLPIGL